ncbi:hypothetical protein [Mangrovibacterium marinum]|uniref:Outer membrane protein with beta-barrel domain n=1 Tax=Mangrovibacterium marinum TaxID=1639118 RepID=A0A2T5C1S1_9BACT|nr:hypothetical protein [Mangrovibacterium marinum]PTN08591.1 hypothetical protein C8N47_108148 [Mangrovibacterium marinum]
MKKTLKALLVFGLASIFALNVQAQDEASGSSWDTGLDIYSSYIWRGAKFGSGVAFQPYIEFSTGGFALGAWGSTTTDEMDGYEMDLYAGYDFGPVSVNLTDYYFGGDWTCGDEHFLEPSITFSLGDFSLMGAYMMNDYYDVDDTYIEAGYSFGKVDVALGAGDGQYTDDGDFNVCNISVGTSKEIQVTDSWTLPVSGSVILNPSTGGFFITAGISF